jgi:hypothetical protein
MYKLERKHIYKVICASYKKSILTGHRSAGSGAVPPCCLVLLALADNAILSLLEISVDIADSPVLKLLLCLEEGGFVWAASRRQGVKNVNRSIKSHDTASS